MGLGELIRSPYLWEQLRQASGETLAMTFISLALAEVIGIPIGVWLTLSRPGHLRAHPAVYQVLGTIVNVGRSLPFIILMVAIIPFTRWVVGTSIGTWAAIVPLTVAAIPFVARLVETSLNEVEWGVIEAAQAMGASLLQIVWRVLLREARPGLVAGATITAINLIGYSAMAGAIGGGGLGDLAIRYGYQRFQPAVMLVTLVVLVVVVQGIQFTGDVLVRRLDHRG
ncbi:MAG: ABC transporter permease [Limnochordaceae bacterium]|nr:ABC transporter permease [Limnochordaceae bacterium]